MTENTEGKKVKKWCCDSIGGSGSCGGAGYFLGIVGAAVYYITTATTILGGVLGVLKALVWPAFLVYEVLQFLAA